MRHPVLLPDANVIDRRRRACRTGREDDRVLPALDITTESTTVSVGIVGRADRNGSGEVPRLSASPSVRVPIGWPILEIEPALVARRRARRGIGGAPRLLPVTDAVNGSVLF